MTISQDSHKSKFSAIIIYTATQKSLTCQKAFSNDLAGIGDQHKCSWFYAPDVVAQSQCLTAFHGSHDNCFIVVSKGTFCMVYSCAAV